jgi:murein DD-endopeptidase MepM/ murein hydrolase activator NlpD
MFLIIVQQIYFICKFYLLRTTSSGLLFSIIFRYTVLMHIEIQIPRRPKQTMFLITLGLIVWFSTGGSPPKPAVAESRGGEMIQQARVDAEASVNRERIRQAVLARREEILRYELMKLEEEARTLMHPVAVEQLTQSRTKLLAIIAERRASEDLLKKSLYELWDSQGTAIGTSKLSVILDWPVEPAYGLSATFDDSAYEKRFGVAHHAIDIPVEQGSIIKAAADGVVAVVKDNGYGYSYVAIDHDVGVRTVYGHVSGFIAKEGQRVRRGDPIAYSGGRPGSPGAGLLTTGPHLHFAVRQDGKLVDPLDYLTPRPGLKISSEE